VSRVRGGLSGEGCPAHGKTVPLLPLLELLRDLLDASDRDSDQKVRETIAGRLVLLDREFEETLPLAFEFLGVASPVPRRASASSSPSFGAWSRR